MKNFVTINKIINPYSKILNIEGDKSLSIRWALLASQAKGKSRSYNLLKSEDVLSSLNCLKKLGVKKGDILFWHSKSIHRGTVQENKNSFRKAITMIRKPILYIKPYICRC